MKSKLLIALLLLSATTSPLFAADHWREQLQKELPLLGHRNWIVVVDSAYPLQVSPGIETICTDSDQLTVVKEVLTTLAKTQHVKPIIYTDEELNYVAEKNAPGISAYRDQLSALLQHEPVQALLHEQIIAKLDEAGKTFKVLVIKTPLTKPYTSVFFQLQCGYWNAESEAELRQAMKTTK